MRSRTGTSRSPRDATSRSTSHRIGLGLAIVPEDRRLFGPMTAGEPELGAYLHGSGTKEVTSASTRCFPSATTGAASCGTLGRRAANGRDGTALMSRPQPVMDEPSMGLAPISSSATSRSSSRCTSRAWLLVVEQNANVSLDRRPRMRCCRPTGWCSGKTRICSTTRGRKAYSAAERAAPSLRCRRPAQPGTARAAHPHRTRRRRRQELTGHGDRRAHLIDIGCAVLAIGEMADDPRLQRWREQASMGRSAPRAAGTSAVRAEIGQDPLAHA